MIRDSRPTCRILASCTSALVFAAASTAQPCKLAGLRVYGTSNPAHLRSVAPGEYLVPNTTLFLQSTSTAPRSWLAISARSAQIPLPAPAMGDLLVNPSPWILVPGGPWQLAVPGGIPLGARVFVQSFHLTGGVLYAANAIDFLTGYFAPEIGVTAIDVPSNLIGGVGPRTWRVHVKNSGPAPAAFFVALSVGSNNGGNGVQLNGYTTGWTDILMPTPASFGPKGGSNTVPVQACANVVDCNPSNNCAQTTAKIAVPYWDLQLSLVRVPTQVTVGPNGTNIQWHVRVVNAGNVVTGGSSTPSTYAVKSGINCSNGRGPNPPTWGCTPNTPVQLNNLQPLAAQASTSLLVKFFLPTNTWRQTQWVKAEVTAGDADPTGNFTEQAIAIH